MDDALDEQVRALREGRAFVRPAAATVSVRGGDAGRWLNDLLTAGVDALTAGASVRSLLLSPTGRIRADLHVLRSADAFLLLQGLDQPEPVERILAPYVLSSDVILAADPRTPILVAAAGGWRAALEPPEGAVEVGDDAAERWRIESSVVRFPVDLDDDALPAEAGLDVPPVTETAKGCFLGQESVARVRNLGHPPRVILPATADGSVRRGEAVFDEGHEVGAVTSVAPRRTGGGPPVGGPSDDATPVLVRVRWAAREADLRTAGARLART